MSIQQHPSWQRELRNFKGVKSLFVLEKNVSDLYPVWDFSVGACAPQDVAFMSLPELIKAMFEDDAATGSYQLVFFDLIRHFSNPFGDEQLEGYLRAADRAAARDRADAERLNAFTSSARGQGAQQTGELVRCAELIKALLTRPLSIEGSRPRLSGAQGEPRPVAVVIDMASRLLAGPTNLDPEETLFFSNLLVAASGALRVPVGAGGPSCRNTLILIANNVRDLPEWFVGANPHLRDVVIPMPDRSMRSLYVRAMMPQNPSLTVPGEKSPQERFVDVTDGMTLRELDELRRMHDRDAAGADLYQLVDVYKYGLKENRWADVAEKLTDDPASIVRRRVKGQDRAVSTAVSLLKRSAMGLSGSTHSSGSKPKGVLFLAGPTGTGKTELVKTVTELLFGDERSCLRFDMSEYSSENSDQRLFGAPPGYVGYQQGGQLTNAVRANPFSVVLFDEIEKAHPSIMDKFLQILEDGRMTDGQGSTVYFSETLIFFTSNIGFSREVYDPSGRHVVGRESLIEPGEPYEQIRAKVLDAMRAAFKPEFLGRIGNNVVVFDFIDDESATMIARSKIAGVNRNVERMRGVRVEIDPACMSALVANALIVDVKRQGGRGIANYVETCYLNALSDFLFDARCGQGDTVLVQVREGGGLHFSKLREQPLASEPGKREG